MKCIQDVSKEQSHSSPQNGNAVRATRKTSVPLRSPSSRGNGMNGGSITNGMNGGYSSNGTSADTTLNDHSGASSLNVTADIDDGEEEELELPLTPRYGIYLHTDDKVSPDDKYSDCFQT